MRLRSWAEAAGRRRAGEEVVRYDRGLKQIFLNAELLAQLFEVEQ